MSTLYLVPTPIGNLGDFTLRAQQVLQEADLIACEDTRTSGHLLKHYQISTPTVAFHQHNEHKKVQDLINRLMSGQTVALISDAGMPGISDPGFLITREAHKQQIPVVALPGPNAAITALAASGLPSDRFIYEGFLPHKKGRVSRIQAWQEEDKTVIVYESTHRILKLLSQMEEHLSGERYIAVVREISKTFEEIIRGKLSDVRQICEAHKQLKGEFVVVLAGCDYDED